MSDRPIAAVSTTTETVTVPAPRAGIPVLATSTPFLYEIATSPAAQAKGLSGRSEIKSDYGMLFVFPKKEKQGFWMKDMLASIDIIWVEDDGTVIGIEDSVSPATYPNVFYSPAPVRYVLETRAGEAQRLGLTVGTKLVLPLPYRQ